MVKFFSLIWLMILFMISNETLAGVVMYGTRIIFNEYSDNVVVKFANNDKHPNLMQVWVDNGEGNPESFDSRKTPFNITPPLFKINASEQQTVRIIKNSNTLNLRKDRETMFWFNFLQIPPVTNEKKTPAMGVVSLSFLNQVKLIYRPSALIDGIDESWTKLIFSSVGKNKLQVINNSGYYFTFRDDAKIESLNEKNKIILGNEVTLSPYSKLTWKIEGNKVLRKGDRITYNLINDKGNSVGHIFELM